jgi:hypothetical protein
MLRLAQLGIDKNDMHNVQKLPVDKMMAAYFAVVRDARVDQNNFGSTRFTPRRLHLGGCARDDRQHER